MAESTERLLLEVDARIELLRRHLQEGEQPLDKFERRAGKMAEAVDRSIGDMGKRFGPLAQMAEDAASRAERAFTASFSQVQKIAATAIKGPTVDGRINLGAEDIRAGAAAAQEQARAFELIEAAARRTAATEGDASEATRLFIAATSASRIEAEQKARALLAEAGALERVEIELAASAEATDLFVTKHQRVAQAAEDERQLTIRTAEAATQQKALAASADQLRAQLDPMYAAQQRFDAELLRADQLLKAGVITTREYEQAHRMAAAALQDHAARVTGVAERQKLLADRTAATARAEQEMASAAVVLRGQIDPMYAAQQRFDAELNEAERLLQACVITTREYDQAVLVARERLYTHARAVAGSNEQQRRLISSGGALRAAMSGASYQVQDFFTQLSMGANVIQVAVIQGGQLTGQFANIEAQAGTTLSKFVAFSRFMQGPYGIAIQASLLVLTPFVSKLIHMATAQDDATEKLREDAKAAAEAERAKAAFTHSIDGVTAALRDQDKALRDVAEGERTAAERANLAARTKRDEALAIRQATAARLADAVAQEQALQTAARDQQRYGRGEAATIAAQLAAGRVVQLQGDLDKATQAATQAERELNVTRVDLAAEQAATAIDPVRSVTKLYDQRIKALKDQQREEARLGQQVGAESKRRLEQLEREKAKAVEAAQARASAARRTGNNDQLGRTINVDEARAIVASIGGRVTSGTRSAEEQRRIYADHLAGRHKGPVAKPGTSDHERGQAVDVAYGPGISIASLRDAFRRQGVALRQIIDEPAQRVIHVAFGKAGPSAAQVAGKAETARRKLLTEDSAYTDEERQARRALIGAMRKSAETEQQRENLIAADIAADADAQARKVSNDLSAGKISQAQADHLLELNEATRTQRLQNLIAERATRQIERQFDTAQGDLQARIAVLRIQEDLAPTERERRKVAREILEAEQTLRRLALEKVRDTSQDPAQVQGAREDLARLPAIEQGEQQQNDRRNAGPLDGYRQRLTAATGDMQTALEGVKVRGLDAIEDSFVGIIAGTESVGSAFKRMANQIIADLIRIAVQKLILAAIGGGDATVETRASGGKVERRAGGGRIVGPGTGRSDSILAMIDGQKPLLVSNGESIVTAEATARYWPLIDAMNKGRLHRFANGGMLGDVPRLRAPSLPASLRGGGRRDRVELIGEIKVSPTPEFDARMERMTLRTVASAAEPIMSGAEARTIRRLKRPSLPGAPI